MTKEEKVHILEDIAKRNKNEFYNILINAYKKYDSKQKKIIEDLQDQVKRLNFRIGQLDSYIEELSGMDSKELHSAINNIRFILNYKEKVKKLKEERNAYKRNNLYLERALICNMYPEYDISEITPEQRKEISRILKSE